jgi:hypothetical protein
MTVEQLNATPLYSEVEYLGDRYTIIKIKNGSAILWDRYPGNVSKYIPAAELYIHEYFVPYHKDHTYTPISIAYAPIYWPVSAGGKAGVIVGIEQKTDEITYNAVYVATVFFPATETFGEFRDGDLVFATYVPGPIIGPPPVISPPYVPPIISPPVIPPYVPPVVTPPYVPPVVTPPYVPPVVTPPYVPPVVTPPYVPPVVTPPYVPPVVTPPYVPPVVTPPIIPKKWWETDYMLYGVIGIGVLLLLGGKNEET